MSLVSCHSKCPGRSGLIACCQCCSLESINRTTSHLTRLFLWSWGINLLLHSCPLSTWWCRKYRRSYCTIFKRCSDIICPGAAMSSPCSCTSFFKSSHMLKGDVNICTSVGPQIIIIIQEGLILNLWSYLFWSLPIQAQVFGRPKLLLKFHISQSNYWLKFLYLNNSSN